MLIVAHVGKHGACLPDCRPTVLAKLLQHPSPRLDSSGARRHHPRIGRSRGYSDEQNQADGAPEPGK
jgi:hypothetical protein